MARLIKLANSSKPMIKMSSQEWIDLGLNNNFFYSEDKDVIKIAQITKDRVGMFTEFQSKMSDENWRNYLLSKGFGVSQNPTTGNWRVYPRGVDPVANPNRFIRGNALDGIMNAVNSMPTPPIPVPVPGGGAPVPVPGGGGGAPVPGGGAPVPGGGAPVPGGGGGGTGGGGTGGGGTGGGGTGGGGTPVPPAPRFTRGQMLGMGAAGLGGGLAGYYATEGIANLFRQNNQMKQYKPDEFSKGIYLFQQSMMPILGISKVLSKEVKSALATIGDLQGQFAQRQPGNRAPSMKLRDEVGRAMQKANTPPDLGQANYLPT